MRRYAPRRVAIAVAAAITLCGCPKTSRPRDAGAVDAAQPRFDAHVAPPDAGTGDSGTVEIVLTVDFERSPLGAYGEGNVRNDWPGLRWASSERATIVEENGNRFVRILYPRGTFGTAANGAQWQVGFPAAYDELWLRYRVRFRDGFDPVLGGKLPGLIGGEANTGGERPDGTDGWSARMMWRSALAVVQYVYHPDQPNNFGEDLPWDVGGQRAFVAGRWHTLEHHVVMNSPGERDGIIEGFFDGVRGLERTNLRFRNVESLAIDGFYFSTFFGGSTADWASSRDETIDFDDFVVSTARLP
jgi:hypothetical protein